MSPGSNGNTQPSADIITPPNTYSYIAQRIGAGIDTITITYKGIVIAQVDRNVYSDGDFWAAASHLMQHEREQGTLPRGYIPYRMMQDFIRQIKVNGETPKV